MGRGVAKGHARAGDGERATRPAKARQAVPNGLARSRWLTLGLLGIAGTWVFGWFRDETGSAALAVAATSLVLTLLLLPLRCQLDPCRN